MHSTTHNSQAGRSHTGAEEHWQCLTSTKRTSLSVGERTNGGGKIPIYQGCPSVPFPRPLASHHSSERVWVWAGCRGSRAEMIERPLVWRKHLQMQSSTWHPQARCRNPLQLRRADFNFHFNSSQSHHLFISTLDFDFFKCGGNTTFIYFAFKRENTLPSPYYFNKLITVTAFVI